MGRTATSNVIQQIEDGTFFIFEVPIGTVNGTNTVFTLTYAPSPTNSLRVVVNGMEFKVTEDYSFSGTTITFNTAPPSGTILKVKYHVTPTP